MNYEKSCISYQFRANGQTCSYQPQYTVDNKAENDVCTQKWQVAAASMIGKWDPPQNQHLTASYNNHWIGRGRLMAWPPRSSDLTPMVFFLWGHIKALIYTWPVDCEEDLIVHIVEAAGTWHFWAHISLCCIVVRCTRLVVVWLDICSKLIRNIFFSSESSSGSAWFPILVRPNLMVRSAIRTNLRHIVPWR